MALVFKRAMVMAQLIKRRHLAVNIAVCDVQCAVWIVLFAVCSVECGLFSVQWSVCSI